MSPGNENAIYLSRYIL